LKRRRLIGAAMMEMSETGFFPQSIPIKFPHVPLWGKNPICIICIIHPYFGTGLQGEEIQGIREQASIFRIRPAMAHNLKK
jgi:hypothetical protein